MEMSPMHRLADFRLRTPPPFLEVEGFALFQFLRGLSRQASPARQGQSPCCAVDRFEKLYRQAIMKICAQRAFALANYDASSNIVVGTNYSAASP